jgi:hypothetical protein
MEVITSRFLVMNNGEHTKNISTFSSSCFSHAPCLSVFTDLIECEMIEAAGHVTPTGANQRSLRSFGPSNNKVEPRVHWCSLPYPRPFQKQSQQHTCYYMAHNKLQQQFSYTCARPLHISSQRDFYDRYTAQTSRNGQRTKLQVKLKLPTSSGSHDAAVNQSNSRKTKSTRNVSINLFLNK